MKSILVIEDNKDIRENTAEILDLAGYKTFTAENGKKGVDIAIREKPDVIVCDIMMPELDGYQVLEHVRSDPSRSGTRRRSWSRRSSTSETLNAGSLVDKLTARRTLPSRRVHEHP